MNHLILRIISLALILGLLLPAAAFAAENEDAAVQTVIVSFDASADRQALLESLCEKYGLSVTYDFENLGMAALRSIEPLTPESLQKLLADIAAEEGVLSAEPDQIIELDPREWEGFDTPVSDEPVTRAQAVLSLWRSAGSPVVNHIIPFTDVDQESDYGEAVRWAAAEGITAGTGNGCFSPEAKVTKEQLAAMLYAYAKKQGKGFSGMWMFLLQAQDREEIAEYAYEPICWLSMKGVLKTGDDGMLWPKATVTAAELEAIAEAFRIALTE